ncbi:deleted in malignant brain tumors 1 protein-like [Danio aesculapii]|uniref:deleted in malignant brain tumors 1 protein-like n=1 Tax=Danio aesculapii TaxID=1142201 RepID=UPI0024C05ED5|nr:deleted in malignant brain tumors 1 protein-like [Danio aesculapii]
MTDRKGELFSPQYPNNYPNNARCTWTIHSTANTTVSLTFNNVSLESCCDYIRVHDGPSTLYPSLEEIRNYRNQSIKSTGNTLTVLFYSDSSVTSRGFHANWTFVDPPSDDPCYRYTVLDDPWRATTYNGSSLNCDTAVKWFGWYRLFFNGRSVQMPDRCVDKYRCGTHAPLWLNGQHPKVGDGVVTRDVCGHWSNNCCYFRSAPIRVKACPGDYYVYEFAEPPVCKLAYCADVEKLNTSYTTVTPETLSSANTTGSWTTEPCGGKMTDRKGELFSPQYPNNYPNNARCTWTIHSTANTTVSLTFNNVSLESCCDYIRVHDGPSTLYPSLEEIRNYRNQSIKSTGNTLTVLFYSDSSVTSRGFHANWTFVDPPSDDPCYRYTVLDDPWRATTYNGLSLNCDTAVKWFGWYRLFIYGQSVQMPDRCVDKYRCGTHAPLWLNGQHPKVGDGVVTRNVCGHWSNNSCHFRSAPIRVKACPGDYYVYEFVEPPACNLAYCADVEKLNTSYTTVTPETLSSANTIGSWTTSSWLYSTRRFLGYPVSHPQCGGHLFGSGMFSSPNYPNYYHDNAYCVWYLSAQQGQRIFLTFTDVQLKRCCDCDYITIHDGSSTGYPQLGKVCFNETTHQAFHSSSRYLTVVFRSDYTSVSHGFQALFTSSLTANEGSVDCTSDNMVIVLQSSYLNSLGLSGNDLYVDDHLCRPNISSTEVVFRFPLDTCGTAKETMNSFLSYTNNVRASQSQSGEITRQSLLFLHVGCRMEKDTMVQIFYKVKETVNANITGTGRFNASIALYTSRNFTQQIYDSPYEVNLNQQLFVQVKLTRSDESLDLFLDTCVASPNSNDFINRSYDLLRTGCPRDSTYLSYTNGVDQYARFSFRAFKFLQTHAYVYLQCKVIICPDTDYNSRCRKGCQYRRKRSLDSSYNTSTVMLGPIKLRGQRPVAGQWCEGI